MVGGDEQAENDNNISPPVDNEDTRHQQIIHEPSTHHDISIKGKGSRRNNIWIGMTNVI